MSSAGWGLAFVTTLSLVFYARELLSWRKGMYKAFSTSSEAGSEADNDEVKGISIIIPFRNESARWEGLFGDLQSQKAPKGEWEVLFVDDHSEDGGREALEGACEEIPNFRTLKLPDEESGKKRALAFGIREASYEKILTLDADCRVGDTFLQKLFERSRKKRADLHLLPVLPHPPSGFRDHLIYYEALALLGVLIGSVEVGAPRLANGAGMLFSRSVFFEEGEYGRHLHIDSGDDLFLLQEWTRQGRRVEVLPHRPLLVRTCYPDGVREWLDQRLRWGTKAKAFEDRGTLWSLWTVGMVDLLLILNVLFTVVVPSQLPVLLFSWGVKGGLDRIFLISSLQRLGKRFSWKHFPLALLFHPFQIVLIPVIALFRRPYWKGRRIADH